MTSRLSVFVSSLSRLSERNISRIFWGVLLVVTLLRFAAVYCSPLDLAGDEAHYWEWSRRLDWSYYSKGPGIALLIRASTALFGQSEFTVRLPALLCQFFFFALFFVTARRCSTPQAALLVSLLLQCTIVFSSLGLVMTTDAPLALCWLAALALGLEAVRGNDRAWILSLAAIGLACEMKYTAGILLAGTIFFLFLSPQRRRVLFSSPFIFGLISFAVFLLPILFWNSEHGWVNLAHNAGHITNGGKHAFTFRYLAELIGGQLGLLMPLAFVIVVTVLVRGFRLLGRTDPEADYLWWSAVPLIVLCLGVAVERRVYANWPMPAYIGALLLFARSISQTTMTWMDGAWFRAGFVLSLIAVVVVHFPYLGCTLGLPGTVLPTGKLVGWKELASTADKNLQHMKTDDTPAIISSDYESASALAFYSKEAPQVFCVPLGQRRMNQFDIWGGWKSLRGRDALLVLKGPQVPRRLRKHFRHVSVAQPFPNFQKDYAGASLRTFFFFVGRNYDGYAMPRPVAR